MIHTISYRQFSVVKADTDPLNWSLEYADSTGVIHQYKPHYPGIEGNQIRVDYAYIKKFPDGSSGRIERGRFFDPALMEFYDMIMPPIKRGYFDCISTLNGLFSRLPEFEGSMEKPNHFRLFNYMTGEGLQPVTFDLTISQPNYDQAAGASPNGEITVTPVDGIASFEYQINEEPRQSSSVFTGLSQGGYKITVYDSAGSRFSRQVQLQNQFVDLAV